MTDEERAILDYQLVFAKRWIKGMWKDRHISPGFRETTREAIRNAKRVRDEIAPLPPEIISEDWLLENLPHGWTYDCRFEPEPAFIISAGVCEHGTKVGGEFVLPLRLLANPTRDKSVHV